MTEDNRKLRTDAWYAALPEEAWAAIRDRMRRFVWYEVVPWVAETYAVAPPCRSSLYRFCEWFDDHESEFLLRQRLRDKTALARELAQAGAADPEQLVGVLGNDVIAARAKGDDKAVERAVRAYKTIASIVGDTRDFSLKVKEFEQAQRDFDLRKQDMEIKLRRLELLESKLHEAQDAGTTVDPKALADEVDRILGRKQA